MTPARLRFKSGDIIRYASGVSALFRFDGTVNQNRLYGSHVMGGAHSASDGTFFDLHPASAEDIEFCRAKRPEWFEGENKAMSRERDVAYYGPLVLRVTDRMMQFRYDRAKAVIDGTDAFPFPDDKPEGLTRYDEAKALIAIIRAHDGLSGIDAHGDAGESERLYGLSVGHVLTDQDVRDIESLIADNNDMIGHEAEKWHEARVATLREIGGEELVKACEARDEAIMSSAVERAMAKFRQSMAEKEVGGATPAAKVGSA